MDTSEQHSLDLIRLRGIYAIGRTSSFREQITVVKRIIVLDINTV